MDAWHAAQRKNIRRMKDATLEKEVAFAESFAPATSDLEQTWLDELHAEKERRELVRDPA